MDTPDIPSKHKTNKVIDYKLVEVPDVHRELKDGWELYGSPIFNSNNRIYQAMVKYQVVTFDVI